MCIACCVARELGLGRSKGKTSVRAQGLELSLIELSIALGALCAYFDSSKS